MTQNFSKMNTETTTSLQNTFAAQIENFDAQPGNIGNRYDIVEKVALILADIAQQVGIITDNEIPEATCSGTATAYNFNGKYYVTIETNDVTEIVSCREFGEALKIATDKLYEHVTYSVE